MRKTGMIAYEWEKLFQPEILSRGFEYYYEDHVERIAERGGRIHGEVAGTRLYDVVIRIKDGQVGRMTCTCPYASDGTNCKHMAAVLYQWEDLRETQAEEEPEEDEDLPDPSAMVSSVGEVFVREFLTMVLKEDERYRNRFQLMTGDEISEAQMRRYQKKADRIARDFMNADDFIPFELAGEFREAMEDFMEENIVSFIDNGYYQDAFALSMYIFRMLQFPDPDDAGDDLAALIQNCVKYWERIPDAADEAVQDTMLERCIDVSREDISYASGEAIESFLMRSFHTQRQLKRKLEYTAEKCAHLQEHLNTGVRFQSDEVWCERHLSLLVESGADEEQIEDFCAKKWQTGSVRQYVIDRCARSGDYARAEQVLLESLKMDGSIYAMADNYYHQLLELYEMSGQKEKYKDLLKELVMTRYAGNMKMYRDLRAQYEPDAWKKVVSDVLNTPGWERYRAALYAEEKMTDRLLEPVRADGSLRMAKEYTLTLKTDYPEELPDVYESALQKAAVNAAGRTVYQEWAGALRKMRKEIPGGEERVRKILDGRQFAYSNRPAMMDELRWVWVDL